MMIHRIHTFPDISCEFWEKFAKWVHTVGSSCQALVIVFMFLTNLLSQVRFANYAIIAQNSSGAIFLAYESREIILK